MHAIDIPEGLSANYANMVRIAHMPTEFVLDFALKLPGTAPAEVTSRVLISPLSAKLFGVDIISDLQHMTPDQLESIGDQARAAFRRHNRRRRWMRYARRLWERTTFSALQRGRADPPAPASPSAPL